MDYIQFRDQVKLDIRQSPGEETDERKYYRARISSDELDSHYSEMDISTLQNFATEAGQGVAILDSHNHRTVGIGRSISGELIDQSVYSNFYILKGLDLNNQSFRTSDSFMRAIDSGMLTDVSVGFYGHSEICQLCNEELWNGSCFHWPGMSYIIEDDGKKEIQVCTTLIVDGHLSEFSLVYDGALQGATIVEKSLQKAQNLYENKRFTDEHQRILNERFNIRFNQNGRATYEGQSLEHSRPLSLPGINLNTNNNNNEEGPTVDHKDKVDEQAQIIKDLRESNASLKESSKNVESLKAENDTLKERNSDLEQSVQVKEDLIGTLRNDKKELKDKVDALQSLEEDAKRYREVKEARAEKCLESWTSAEKLKEREIPEDEIERKKKAFMNLETLEDIDEQKSLYDERIQAREDAKQNKAETPDPGDPEGRSQDDDNDDDDYIVIER